MKYTENIGLPIVEDNDLYSKEINNLAFEEIDKNIEALAERIDLIDNPETGLGNLLEIIVRKEDIAQDLDNPEREQVLSTEALVKILDKKTEEIETLIEDTDNATRLDLTNKVLLNKVVDVALNDSNELIVTYGDGTELNVGVVGTGGAGTSSENKIEVETSTDEEYILKITTDGTDFLTPNLKGAGDNIFVGTEIDGTSTPIIADITGSHIGDIYINADNGNLYVRDDENNVNNHWTYKGNIRGTQGKSNYDLALDNGFIGTEQDYLDSLVAENIEALIVDAKPVLADPNTKLKTWYYYQVDGDTDGSAWKYKMVLPNTADYPAGDYCVYYDLKPYCGTFTAESPALTNKDKYKYYVIMDLQAVTTEVIREDLNTGNTVVLETVQCIQQEPTTHTVINTPMESLGKWVQTLFLGATKEEASEVTLSTGTSVSGFITSKAFEETVGNRSNLKTLDKTSIVNAINEHEELLRENTTVSLNTNSKNVIGAINELNAKHHLDVFDLVGGNVLDYALTADALTYTCFYANNCDGLPNNERYGYCYVEVSQDPLYRDIIFNSPTTGRRWSITIGSAPDNPAIQGEWSEWHEELLREDIASVLDDTVTDKQVPSAKAVYTELNNKLDAGTVANKIDSSAIVTVLDNTATDEQVPSAKVVYDELNTKANDDEVVKKTDISNTIDSTSTDSKLPTSKAVYDTTKYSSIGLECPGNKSPLEFALENMKSNTILYFNSWGNTSGTTPDAWASYIGIRHKERENLFLIDIGVLGDFRVNSYRNGDWSGWRKLCTTSIADVGKTAITLNTMSDITFGNVSGFYLVSNGICTVDITFNCTTTATIEWATAFNSLPIPKYLFHASAPASSHDTPPLLINVKTNGAMEWFIASPVTDNRTYYVHFSYPVAK